MHLCIVHGLNFSLSSADQTLLFLQVVDTTLTSFTADPVNSHSQQMALLTQYLIRQNIFRYLGQSLEVMVCFQHHVLFSN